MGSHYQLQQLQLQSDFLDIYSVTCLCSGGTRFEAQAFSLSLPRGNGRDNMGSNSNSSSSSNSSDSSDNGRGSGSDDDGNDGACKLLASRRRRMRRIYRSQNFVGSFERGGKRFLVSKVTRSDAEWREVCWQIRRHQKEEHQQHDFIVNSQCTDARTRVHSGEGKSRGLAKGSGTPGPSCRWSPHAMSSLDQVSSVPSAIDECKVKIVQ